MREFKAGSKINFIDLNDVYVGYDMDGQCCEQFGYFYSQSPATHHLVLERDIAICRPHNLDEYYFDKEWKVVKEMFDYTGYGYGGAASFRLLAAGQPDVYLTLYNFHNGYYSHGFEVKLGDKLAMSDSL